MDLGSHEVEHALSAELVSVRRGRLGDSIGEEHCDFAGVKLNCRA